MSLPLDYSRMTLDGLFMLHRIAAEASHPDLVTDPYTRYLRDSQEGREHITGMEAEMDARGIMYEPVCW